MLKSNKIILILFFVLPAFSFAQSLTGTVFELDNEKKKSPMTGVNLHWSGTMVAVSTDKEGHFKIQRQSSNDTLLVVSFVGYKTDTMVVKRKEKNLEIVLSVRKDLKEVVIQGRQDGSYISKMEVLKTEIITGEGLQKAACCNLSESFQNSATVDVSFSDAVTGSKQIQMLGLAGVYSQILSENIPAIRGLATAFGLGFIPGPWMNSIQISKGAASVINGYESITGQINVENKNPETSEKLYLNLYGNSFGRTEININSKKKLNNRWSTALLLHGEKQLQKVDANHDSFIDLPMVNQFNIFSRWQYIVPGKFESRFGFKILQEDRLAGQLGFNTSEPTDTSTGYGIGIKTKRYEVFAKNGFMFPGKPYKSIGTIVSLTMHEQNSYFGLKKYDGLEQNLYVNLIYQTIIGNTNHKISSGISFNGDNVEEKYNQQSIIDTIFKKQELVPGVFSQYTYTIPDKLTLIAGIRADYNSAYGVFITPRLHFKYHLGAKTTFRGSVGKGYRVANIFPENSGILTSSRILVICEKLKPEEAWNYGINMIRQFKVAKKEASFSVDFFRTDFINQVIVDQDSSMKKVYVYNLNGKSYSNSMQSEISVKPFNRFEVMTAFRWVDVKTTINKKLVDKPFVSNYKGLVSLSYATNLNKWKFDFTAQYNGKSRLPNTSKAPPAFRRLSTSPDYTLLFLQITKRFKYFEVYAGCENILGFVQKDPIISADKPFGSHFDASMIWGPITGRTFYGGIRYAIK